MYKTELEELEQEEYKMRCEFYEDMLIDLGAFEKAPCFICGYNGPGYFQSKTHKCAERYHRRKIQKF